MLIDGFFAGELFFHGTGKEKYYQQHPDKDVHDGF
jgi:hypothetical protein